MSPPLQFSWNSIASLFIVVTLISHIKCTQYCDSYASLPSNCGDKVTSDDVDAYLRLSKKTNLLQECDSEIDIQKKKRPFIYGGFIGDTVTVDDTVINQYKNLPYPPFSSLDVLKEATHYNTNNAEPLVFYPSITLEKTNHFLYQGKEQFQNSFRIIVAGGGTGGASAYMGEQINHTNGEIVYLDFSSASMLIAQERTRIRSLRNIIWVRYWIEGLRFLGLGRFQKVQCSGVLHHLKRPSVGLNLLKDILAKRGGMILMVYGLYGRIAIYQMQQLIKMIYTDHSEVEKELKYANQLINVLPFQNWFKMAKYTGDHLAGEIGFYDVFLHKRDLAFTIPTLLKWVKSAGLYFVEFDHYKKRAHQRTQYVTFDYRLSKKLSHIDRVKGMCIAEQLKGDMTMHSFYASKMKDSVSDVNDPSNVMYIYGNPHGLRSAIQNKRNLLTHGDKLYFTAWMYETNIPQNYSSISTILNQNYIGSNHNRLMWEWNDFIFFLLNRMLDTKKGVKLLDVFADYEKKFVSKGIQQDLQIVVTDFYESVKDSELFLMKKEYVNIFPKTAFRNCFQIKDS